MIDDLTLPDKQCWRVAFVYANKDTHVQRQLWSFLEEFTSPDHPVLVGGDFNCLLCSGERQGRRPFVHTQGLLEMDVVVAELELH